MDRPRRDLLPLVGLMNGRDLYNIYRKEIAAATTDPIDLWRELNPLVKDAWNKIAMEATIEIVNDHEAKDSDGVN